MDWQVEYYRKENGVIPVLDYLISLDAKMRAKVFSEIELLEKHGTDLREPYVKPIQGKKFKGLFELRVKLSSNISRIFYFAYSNRRFIILHGYTKRTDNTSISDLERALNYKNDYERRCKYE